MKKLLLLLLIASATFTYANEDYSDSTATETSSDFESAVEESAPATDCASTGDCVEESSQSNSLDAELSDDSDLEVEQ